MLEYKAKNKRNKETLLTCLADLFYSIVTQKRKVGTIAPKKFIARLRKEKVEFDNYMQQVRLSSQLFYCYVYANNAPLPQKIKKNNYMYIIVCCFMYTTGKNIFL